ncbi:thiazole tautomerase TenI [Heyndrickxia shackletonii]|nr:thiazole tautomerase TenI [Heyndrickxia shackletonii]NEZ00908.1 thiazole tautomerase TenI [Heyndrickxia shackletonii]
MRPELHIISTGMQSVSEMVQIVGEIHPYIDAFHIREKKKSARELIEIVNQLNANGVPLEKIIINDRIDVAMVARVKGVQLAYHSLDISAVRRVFPSLRLGCSVHSLNEALYAEKFGADYVLFGHIFSTQSKPDVEPRGLEKLREVTTKVTIPVISIGGIDFKHVKKVLKTGVQGVAVMSGVMLADNPLQAVKEYSFQLGLRERGKAK